VRQAFFIIAVVAILVIAGCGNQRRNGAQTSGLTPTPVVVSPSKTATIIPADVRLVARDAGIVLSAGGYTLSWKYENPGDYSQDGKVGIEDLTPIAQHFGEASAANNEWIDGSGDNIIGVAEITAIAMNWASEVTGYRIDGADATSGPWSEVSSLTLDGGDALGGRLAFAREITPGNTYYRIVTLTPDGDAAFSDTLIAPSNEPIIYGITPTSGYQHEEYTFTAAASSPMPGTSAALRLIHPPTSLRPSHSPTQANTQHLSPYPTPTAPSPSPSRLLSPRATHGRILGGVTLVRMEQTSP
jgi:hypothetical protein